MIVKVQTFKDSDISAYEEEMYFNVEKIFKKKDKIENDFLYLKIKNQEEFEIIPITRIDENGNHPSLVGAVWLMNGEGKTIERLY